MKLYRVERHGSGWHLISPFKGVPIGASNDIRLVVEWARLLATRNRGEVHLYDDERLEAVFFEHDAEVPPRMAG